VPYGGSAYELNTSAVYPTDSLWVLVPADVPVDTADLRLDRTADIGRLRYKVLVGDGLAAGQRVSLSIAGLPYVPRPWLLDEQVQRTAALGLAALGVVVAWAYAHARSRTEGALPAAALTEPRDAL
jgi:hypothetical protein